MINKEKVKYMAHLARIQMNDDQLLQYTKNLEAILNYVEKLIQLNVQDVIPTSHVLNLQNVYRKDQPAASLLQEEVLKLAVEKYQGSFKVPQVIET